VRAGDRVGGGSIARPVAAALSQLPRTRSRRPSWRDDRISVRRPESRTRTIAPIRQSRHASRGQPVERLCATWRSARLFREGG
jgi:hypothetical protein